MKVFNHVLNTWILAQVLHPVIFFTYFSVFLNDPVYPGALISLLVGAVILSAPSLFISYLLLRTITGKSIPITLSCFIWIFISFLSIILNIGLFVFLLKGNLFDIPLHFVIPAFIAALFSISIRLPLFLKLISETKHQKTEEDIIGYEN
jgi:hypothetical protein